MAKAEESADPVVHATLDRGGINDLGINTQSPPSRPIEDLIRQYFPECPEIAIAVARAESNLDASRIGDKHLAWDDGRNGMSCGLMQIRVFPGRPSCDELLDPVTNVQYARKIYEKSGWTAWSTWKSGRYKLFL